MPMLGFRAINYIRMHDGFMHYFTCIRMHFSGLFKRNDMLCEAEKYKGLKYILSC
jgi:hypothetical protein